MTLVMQIIKKDLSLFRWAIAGYWLAFAVLTFLQLGSLRDSLNSSSGGGFNFLALVALLVLLGGISLLTLISMADRVVGTQQHWLARPASWAQILSAKLLLAILIFLVPLLLSCLIIIQNMGFPIAGHFYEIIHRVGIVFLVGRGSGAVFLFIDGHHFTSVVADCGRLFCFADQS
jgi:hypothetical protein